MARAREIADRSEETLARILAEETGADDGTPRVVAAMIYAVIHRLVDDTVSRKLAGQTLQEMRAEVYATAERAFDLLESGIGDYGARPATAPAPEPLPRK